jgi:hypothetical protein
LVEAWFVWIYGYIHRRFVYPRRKEPNPIHIPDHRCRNGNPDAVGKEFITGVHAVELVKHAAGISFEKKKVK